MQIVSYPGKPQKKNEGKHFSELKERVRRRSPFALENG
jgi:hypothetical protein